MSENFNKNRIEDRSRHPTSRYIRSRTTAIEACTVKSRSFGEFVALAWMNDDASSVARAMFTEFWIPWHGFRSSRDDANNPGTVLPGDAPVKYSQVDRFRSKFEIFANHSGDDYSIRSLLGPPAAWSSILDECVGKWIERRLRKKNEAILDA